MTERPALLSLDQKLDILRIIPHIMMSASGKSSPYYGSATTTAAAAAAAAAMMQLTSTSPSPPLLPTPARKNDDARGDDDAEKERLTRLVSALTSELRASRRHASELSRALEVERAEFAVMRSRLERERRVLLGAVSELKDKLSRLNGAENGAGRKGSDRGAEEAAAAAAMPRAQHCDEDRVGGRCSNSNDIVRRLIKKRPRTVAATASEGKNEGCGNDTIVNARAKKRRARPDDCVSGASSGRSSPSSSRPAAASGASSSASSADCTTAAASVKQRLFLLRHASACTVPIGETCGVTRHCSEMKRVLEHLGTTGCKDGGCKVRHCVSSRYVLSKYPLSLEQNDEGGASGEEGEVGRSKVKEEGQ